jgi:hypothetical protein
MDTVDNASLRLVARNSRLENKPPLPPALSGRLHNSLPAELLIKIFLIWRDDTVYVNNFSASPWKPDWLAVSWVCRSWRTVSLSYTIFWDYIEVTAKDRSPGFVDEIFRRSGQAPLYLDIWDVDTENGTMPLLISRQLSRLKGLVIHAPVIRRDSPELSNVFTQQAPNITHITLDAREYMYGHLLVHLAAPRLPALFGNSLPLLRGADIRLLPMAPLVPLLANVARLCLHNYDDLYQTISSLKDLRRLEDLEINLDVSFERDVRISTITSLGTITRLTIRGCSEAYAKFLSAVSFPSIRLLLWYSSNEYEFYPNITSPLLTLQHHWIVFTSRECPLQHFRISGSPWSLEAYHQEGKHSRERAFLLNLEPGDTGGGPVESIMSCKIMARCLPEGAFASSLQSLDVYGFDFDLYECARDLEESFKEWVDFARACTNVKQLYLTKLDPGFVSILLLSQSIVEVFFPEVTELHLDEYTWVECRLEIDKWLMRRVQGNPHPIKLVRPSTDNQARTEIIINEDNLWSFIFPGPSVSKPSQSSPRLLRRPRT